MKSSPSARTPISISLDDDTWDYIIGELEHHIDEFHKDSCDKNDCSLVEYVKEMKRQNENGRVTSEASAEPHALGTFGPSGKL